MKLLAATGFTGSRAMSIRPRKPTLGLARADAVPRSEHSHLNRREVMEALLIGAFALIFILILGGLAGGLAGMAAAPGSRVLAGRIASFSSPGWIEAGFWALGSLGLTALLAVAEVGL